MAARSIFEWLLEVKPKHGLGATLLFSKPPEKRAYSQSEVAHAWLQLARPRLSSEEEEPQTRDAQILRAMLEQRHQ